MKTISKIVTAILLAPPLVIAYMVAFGMQMSSMQIVSALALLAVWFIYIINPITNPLE